MFTLKNSIKNVYRYRSKYIIIGFLLFIVVLIASVLIGVFNYSATTTEALKTKYAGTVKVMKDLGVKNFNKADFLLFNDCEYVERVDFSSYIISSATLGHFRYDVTEADRAFYSEEDYEALKNQPPVVKTELTIKEETHTLKSLNINPVYIMGYEYDTLPDHKKARFVMESGRMYENDEECVIAVNPKIPDEEWNLLGVGDTIKISVHNGIEKEYTVTGILKSDDTITAETKTRVLFTTFDSAESFGSSIPKDNARVTSGPVNNPIEPTMGIPLSGSAANEIIERYEVLAVLKSYEYYNDFRGYVNRMDDYSSWPLYENFSSILNLLGQLNYWSILFIVIIAIILVFMTIFTTILNLNSRKYEIAVLRSVGMKKSRLIFTFLIENLTLVWGITAVAVIAAQILEPIVIEKVFEGIHSMLLPGMLESLTSTTEVNLIFQNSGIVFGGMTITIILSLILTCVNIVRFQPLKIFNKQY